jgi:hypothetical protein
MAQYEEFTIDQGADVAVEIHCVNKDSTVKDLTGFTATSKLKKTYASDSDSTIAFNTIIATPATDGVLTISLTNAQTDLLKAGRYVYDVELAFLDSDSNQIIERVLEGRVQVSPSVTR